MIKLSLLILGVIVYRIALQYICLFVSRVGSNLCLTNGIHICRSLKYMSGPSQVGGGASGGTCPPPFCRSANPISPRGAHYPHPVLCAPQIFRPCDGPACCSLPWTPIDKLVLERHIFLSKIGGGKYEKKSHVDSLLVRAVYKPNLGCFSPASAFSG